MLTWPMSYRFHTVIPPLPHLQASSRHQNHAKFKGTTILHCSSLPWLHTTISWSAQNSTVGEQAAYLGTKRVSPASWITSMARSAALRSPGNTPVSTQSQSCQVNKRLSLPLVPPKAVQLCNIHFFLKCSSPNYNISYFFVQGFLCLADISVEQWSARLSLASISFVVSLSDNIALHINMRVFWLKKDR